MDSSTISASSSGSAHFKQPIRSGKGYDDSPSVLNTASATPEASKDVFENRFPVSNPLFKGNFKPALPESTRELIDQNRIGLYRKLSPRDRYKILLNQVNRELPAERRITAEQLKAYLPNPADVFLDQKKETASASIPDTGASKGLGSNSAINRMSLCIDEYMEFYNRHGKKHPKSAAHQAAQTFYKQAQTLQNSALYNKMAAASQKKSANSDSDKKPLSGEYSDALNSGFLMQAVLSKQNQLGAKSPDVPESNDRSDSERIVKPPLPATLDESDSELSDVSDSVLESFLPPPKPVSKPKPAYTNNVTSADRKDSKSVTDSKAVLDSGSDSDEADNETDKDYSDSQVRQKKRQNTEKPKTRIITLKLNRLNPSQPNLSLELKNRLDIAATVDDVDDERVKDARRSCRLEGMAYAASKSRDVNSQTYKKALESFGKEASAYVKEQVRRHLTETQGQSDPKTEKRHGLRYLFRRPQKFDAAGNSMGKYDEDFNSVKLSDDLLKKLRTAAAVEDENAPCVVDARRAYRLSAIAYAESKSPNKTSSAYADALHEHYAKASSYVRHEAKKHFKGNDALVYKIGNRFRVLANQLINDKGDLVSKHDIHAFAVTVPPNLETILKATAYIDDHDAPEVVAAQHVVFAESDKFAKQQSGKSDSRSQAYQDEQQKFLKTCVNVVNQETQNRGLSGQPFRKKRYDLFSRFKLPILLEARKKPAPMLYPEFQGEQTTTKKRKAEQAIPEATVSCPATTNALDNSSKRARLAKMVKQSGESVPISKANHSASPTKLVKLTVSPEKLQRILDGELAASASTVTVTKRSRDLITPEQPLALNTDDVNIVTAFRAKVKTDIFQNSFLKMLEESIKTAINGDGVIKPDYADAFAELVDDSKTDRITQLVLKQTATKLRDFANQRATESSLPNKRRKLSD